MSLTPMREEGRTLTNEELDHLGIRQPVKDDCIRWGYVAKVDRAGLFRVHVSRQFDCKGGKVTARPSMYGIPDATAEREIIDDEYAEYTATDRAGAVGFAKAHGHHSPNNLVGHAEREVVYAIVERFS